jgi:hypothetical protein
MEAPLKAPAPGAARDFPQGLAQHEGRLADFRE